jgi:hypothetical protein
MGATRVGQGEMSKKKKQKSDKDEKGAKEENVLEQLAGMECGAYAPQAPL